MLHQLVRVNRRVVGMPARQTLVIALLALPFSHALGQQAPGLRVVRATVTDPHHRFVTGLDQGSFAVLENGSQRPITAFSSVDDPIAVAVVSDAPLSGLQTLHVPGELIETRSLSDAVRQLVASGKPRQALIVTTAATAPEELPADILVARTDANLAQKTVVEVCNQYSVGFTSRQPSANVELVVRQPRGLPTLQANIWK